jgi:hypothetical protein
MKDEYDFSNAERSNGVRLDLLREKQSDTNATIVGDPFCSYLNRPIPAGCATAV